MIDPTRHNALPGPASTASAPARPVFRMVENDRMAGSIPVWDSRPAAQARVENALSAAGQADKPQNFSDALAYATDETAATPHNDDSQAVTGDDEAFGFFDLLDMVNPLQHIPIVSSLYRSITGDEIKPVARIIGGTVFGGPAGGAMSLANVIIEEETGKDITGNVIAMVQGDGMEWRNHTPDQPEDRLNNALAMAAQDTGEDAARSALPPEALAYADMGASHRAKGHGYTAAQEDERMAGTRPRFRSADDDNNNYYTMHETRNRLAETLPPREPITRLAVASLPVIYND